MTSGSALKKKTELVARWRKIVSQEQMQDLHSVIDVLAEANAKDGQGRYFVLIDKLDERWADNAIRFKLIRALIETLSTFRKIQNLKILVSLRTDILERVVQESRFC